MGKYQDFDDFDDFDGPAREPVDLMPYVRTALKHWKDILWWALGGMVLGILIALSIPKTYTSRAVVAPELVTRSTLNSGLSSLANLAGINMNSLALSDAMHPDLYPEVMRSSNFFIGLFDLPVTIREKGETIQTDLYDYMLHYTRTPWWNVVLGIPHIVFDNLKGVFVERDAFEDAEGHAQVDSLHLTKEQANVVKALSKSISASVEKKTFALSVKVTMQDRNVAAAVTNAAIDELKSFVLSYRTEKARELVEFYEQLYQQTQADYHEAQRAAALYADANLGTMTQSAKIRLQQLQNEAQLKYQMYNSTAQNLMSARAKVQQEAPVLVVIQPGVTQHYGKPSKVRMGLLWLVLGGALGTFLVLRKKEA